MQLAALRRVWVSALSRIATDMLLGKFDALVPHLSCNLSKDECARYVAHDIALLEMRSHVDVFELCFIDALRISYDLENGGPQETIRFFAKARPCECLSDITIPVPGVLRLGLGFNS